MMAENKRVNKGSKSKKKKMEQAKSQNTESDGKISMKNTRKMRICIKTESKVEKTIRE